LKQAWREASLIQRFYSLGLILGEALSSFIILYPYYSVSKIYGFARKWSSIETMLPRLRSFFLADNSLIWAGLSGQIQGMGPFRWEHQLFPGLAVILLALIGLAWRPKSENRRIAWLAFWAMLVLVGITLDFRNFSIYRLFITIPGLNSLRSVTRIVLVLMWPGAIFITYVLDSLLRSQIGTGKKYLLQGFTYLMIGLLLIESLAVSHSTFSKIDAQNRLSAIKNMIPVDIPKDPVLILSGTGKPNVENEIDAMLVAQDLGWPVLNGYSGNFPPSYGVTNTCRVLPERIIAYMKFAHISDVVFYLTMMKRVVPVGFADCNPNWWIKIP
jgi:hypothetical protein